MSNTKTNDIVTLPKSELDLDNVVTIPQESDTPALMSLSAQDQGIATITLDPTDSEEAIKSINAFIDKGNVYVSITNFSVEGKYLYVTFNDGRIINCGEVRGKSIQLRRDTNSISYKYEGDDDSQYQTLCTIDEIRLHYSDLTEAQKEELRQPALEAAQHMPFIDANGFWNVYNYSKGDYEVTTYQAKGEVVSVTPSLRQNKLYVTINKSLTE